MLVDGFARKQLHVASGEPFEKCRHLPGRQVCRRLVEERGVQQLLPTAATLRSATEVVVAPVDLRDYDALLSAEAA